MSMRRASRHLFPTQSFLTFSTMRPCFAAFLLLLVLPVCASAYTLVLRSGRQITIPDGFTVKSTAIVYEPAPGFSASIWISNVDVSATERANNEPAGSFTRRIESLIAASKAAEARPAAAAPQRTDRKVITNKDLERSRQQRTAQEEEYERTRRERGLPSKEELRRDIDEQDRRLKELRDEIEAQRMEGEIDALRDQIAALSQSVSQLNSQLGQQSTQGFQDYYPYYYPFIGQTLGFDEFGFRGDFRKNGFRGNFRNNGFRGNFHNKGFGSSFPFFRFPRNPHTGWPPQLANRPFSMAGGFPRVFAQTGRRRGR
jgi:hypothetical protein